METFDEILAAINQGIPNQEISRMISWKDLSDEDLEQLLAIARNMGESRSGYQLFNLLHKFSRDDWFSLRVLGYAIQHTNLGLADRQNTLRTMGKILDKAQTGNDNPDQQSFSSAWKELFAASFAVLNGELEEEMGNPTAALTYYEEAARIYLKLGFSQPASRIKQIMAQVQGITGYPVIPQISISAASVEIPVSTTQKVTTERLAGQIQAQNHALADLQLKIRKLQEKHDRLSIENTRLEERNEILHQSGEPANPQTKIDPRQTELNADSDDMQLSKLQHLKLQALINEGNQRNENLLQELSSEKNRADDLQRRLDTQTGEMADSEQLVRQLAILKQELLSEKEKSGKLQENLDTSQSNLQKEIPDPPGLQMIQDLEQLQEKIDSARAQEDDLQQQIQQKQARLLRLEQLGTQKETLLQEISELKRKVKGLLVDLEDLSSQRLELAVEIQVRTAELTRIDNEISSRKKAVDQQAEDDRTAGK